MARTKLEILINYVIDSRLNCDFEQDTAFGLDDTTYKMDK